MVMLADMVELRGDVIVGLDEVDFGSTTAGELKGPEQQTSLLLLSNALFARDVEQR